MPSRPVRIAAVGDVHAAAFDRAAAEAAVTAAAEADCLLIAGDLTATGEPEEAAVLAEILATSPVPVLYVLGNHDWHANRVPEVRAVLDGAGARMLERDHAELQVDGRTLGIVGLKGFVGGFAGSSLPDFGEPLLRQVHAAATTDVVALDAGLDAVAHCDVRVVLLHYAPTDATLAGEPVGIHAFLGNARMAAPIAEHRPDLVLHGHAHSGTFAGDIDGVPVHNVAAQLLDGPVHVFELDGAGA
jgi:Icc-related predicted phosphoesterase